MRSLRRPIAAFATALAVLTAAMLVASPARAATGDVLFSLPNGCQVIDDPTPTVHTTCQNMTFDGDDMPLSAVSWDYADLTGSSITVPLFYVTSSHRHLVLDNVTYTYSAPIVRDSVPSSIASARYADLAAVSTGTYTPHPFVPWASDGSWGTPIDNTGADFTGATLRGEFQALDVTGSDFTGANLLLDTFQHNVFTDTVIDNTTITVGVIGGIDFGGVNVANSTLFVPSTGGAPWGYASIGGSNFSGVNFTPGGLTLLSPDIEWGGTNLDATTWDGLSFDQLTFPGSSLNNASLRNVTVGGTFKGPNQAHYADFTGLTVLDPIPEDLTGWLAGDADFSGGDYLGATFTGLAVVGDIDFGGANLTSTTISDTVLTSTARFDGANMSFATLDGSTLPVSTGSPYIGTSAVNTTFLVPSASSSLFEDANLAGATFTGGPLNGSQFVRTNLDGSTFDNVGLSGALFRDVSAIGANLSGVWTYGLGGLTVVDSDFTDTTWPAASNNPASSSKWLYGMRIHGTTLTGSDLAPDNLSFVLANPAPAVIDYYATNAWANSDGQSPFTPDGGYWWGSRITGCNLPSGTTLAIGTHTVTCRVAFDSQVNSSPTTWSASPFSWDMASDLTGTNPFTVDGLGAQRSHPGAPVLTAATTRDEMIAAGWWGGAYNYIPASFTTDSDQVTYTSDTVTFNVAVYSVPEASAVGTVFAVGQAPTLGLTGRGYPDATLSVTGLPSGVTFCGSDTDTASHVTTAELCGQPAPGSGGAHSVDLTASNVHGSDVSTLAYWVTEPTIAFDVDDPDAVPAGSDVDVVCSLMTPGGDVTVSSSSGDQWDTVADDGGAVDAVTVTPESPAEPGTLESTFTCADSETGASSSATVTMVLAAGDPAGQALTGAGWVAAVLAVVILLVAYGVLMMSRARRLLTVEV